MPAILGKNYMNINTRLLPNQELEATVYGGTL